MDEISGAGRVGDSSPMGEAGEVKSVDSSSPKDEQVATSVKFHWNLQGDGNGGKSFTSSCGESSPKEGEEAGLMMGLQKTLPLGPHPKVLRWVAVELQDPPLESLP